MLARKVLLAAAAMMISGHAAAQVPTIPPLPVPPVEHRATPDIDPNTVVRGWHGVTCRISYIGQQDTCRGVIYMQFPRSGRVVMLGAPARRRASRSGSGRSPMASSTAPTAMPTAEMTNGPAA